MRTGTLRSISVGAVLAAIVGLVAVPVADAQIISEEVFLIDQAGTLIMPFDNTENHASFQVVTRIPSGDAGPGPVATHWSYWADDCRHLVDVIVCLTPYDTKVMDPSAVQGEVQSPNPPLNNGVGSITDLSGERGMVTVTAFEADTGASGLECNIVDTGAILPLELSGGWVIANTSTTAAFGADALGLAGDVVPDATLISGAEGPGYPRVDLQPAEPGRLGSDRHVGEARRRQWAVFRGRDRTDFHRHAGREPRVLQRDLHGPSGDHARRCPICVWNASGSTRFRPCRRRGTDVPIIPANTTIDAPGFVRLSNCVSRDSEGQSGPLIEADIEQFLFAVHGQAIGPFGAAVYGKYSSLEVF